MAAYNSNAEFLRETIESILNQTFTDFELLIVDDGSNDPLEPIVKSITHDDRVVVYRKENTGLGSSLTYGISRAKGTYIARIDDDDVSVKDRLKWQVNYLDSHPEVSCVGGHIYYRYGNKIYPHSKYPLKHEEIVSRLVNVNFSMAHTALMYRKDAVEKIGCYRIPKGNEDLDLLLKLGTVGKLANIDEYVTYYRLTSTGLSITSPHKAESYIFALESALEFEGYKPYFKDIKTSIKKLKRERYNSLLIRISRLGRKMLIWLTKCCGKKLIV